MTGSTRLSVLSRDVECIRAWGADISREKPQADDWQHQTPQRTQYCILNLWRRGTAAGTSRSSLVQSHIRKIHESVVCSFPVKDPVETDPFHSEFRGFLTKFSADFLFTRSIFLRIYLRRFRCIPVVFSLTLNEFECARMYTGESIQRRYNGDCVVEIGDGDGILENVWWRVHAADG